MAGAVVALVFLSCPSVCSVMLRPLIASHSHQPFTLHTRSPHAPLHPPKGVQCPLKNCLICDNLNGTCTFCKLGQGIMEDGQCGKCTDQDNCLQVNNSLCRRAGRQAACYRAAYMLATAACRLSTHTPI